MEILLFMYLLFGGIIYQVCEDRVCAEFLLAHGAQYDCGNNEGKTVEILVMPEDQPIWYAVEEDFDDMVNYYLGKHCFLFW